MAHDLIREAHQTLDRVETGQGGGGGLSAGDRIALAQAKALLHIAMLLDERLPKPPAPEPWVPPIDN